MPPGAASSATKAGVAARRRARCSPTRRLRVAITDFYNQWIGTSRLDIMTKSATQFPALLDAVRDAMKRGAAAFVSTCCGRAITS